MKKVLAIPLTILALSSITVTALASNLPITTVSVNNVIPVVQTAFVDDLSITPESDNSSINTDVRVEEIMPSLDDTQTDDVLTDKSKRRSSSIPTSIWDLSSNDYTASVYRATWTYTNYYFSNHNGTIVLRGDNQPGKVNVDVIEVGSDKKVSSFTYEPGYKYTTSNLNKNKTYYYKFSIPNVFDYFSATFYISQS